MQLFIDGYLVISENVFQKLDVNWMSNWELYLWNLNKWVEFRKKVLWLPDSWIKIKLSCRAKNNLSGKRRF